MEEKKGRPALRLIQGGKSVSTGSKKVMTAIGLLDEEQMKVWERVRQVATPRPDAILELRARIAEEQKQMQALLDERMALLRAQFPEALRDSGKVFTDPCSLPAAVREVLFAPPLLLCDNGMIVLMED